VLSGTGRKKLRNIAAPGRPETMCACSVWQFACDVDVRKKPQANRIKLKRRLKFVKRPEQGFFLAIDTPRRCGLQHLLMLLNVCPVLD